MGCCDKMFKYIIFLLNFIFFLASVGLIGIGTHIQIKMSNYLDFLNSPYLNTSIVLIIIGVVMLIVSFFGCCGACTENKCMMLTYATLLSLITLTLVGLSIVIYVYKDDVKEVIEDQMQKGMENYNKAGHEGVTETWNMIQNDFDCCGVDNYKDWAKQEFGQNGDVPDDCCISETKGCGKGVGNLPDTEAKKKIYTTGCFAKLEQTIVGNESYAIGIGVGVVILLFIGVLISCCVGRRLGEDSRYV